MRVEGDRGVVEDVVAIWVFEGRRAVDAGWVERAVELPVAPELGGELLAGLP